MATTSSQNENEWQAVSSLVTSGLPSESETNCILLNVAKALKDRHDRGLLYTNLCPETVFFDESSGQVKLAKRPDIVQLGGYQSDPNLTPGWLPLASTIEIPESIEAGTHRLADAGINRPPEAIDLYQLSSLMIRLFSGLSLKSYLQSPKAKSRIPNHFQPILDRGLGFNENDSYQSVDELISDLQPLTSEALGAFEDTHVSGANLKSDTAVSRMTGKEKTRRDDLPWPKLGHYEILDRIGHGGMGDVYRGYERSLDRTVAIKVLPNELAKDPEFVRRFYAEASAAAKLVHPNIVPIHFIGEDQGHHFFAMQYVEGESLAERLARVGQLNIEEMLKLIQQVLGGLGMAHENGLIHRDIKPGNILLDRIHQRAILADFGLVKSLQDKQRKTATGLVMGTVDYFSPEQAQGHAVDARSDLYSVGVVMYQVLSGKLPFKAESPAAMIFQHVYEEPTALVSVLPNVPAPLAAIIHKLLNKIPESRYATCAEIMEDVSAYLQRQPLPSGADIISTDDDGEVFDTSSQQFSQIAPTGKFGRLWQRILDQVQNRAPELVDYLQNTQQQIGRAVETYEKRKASIQQAISEAKSIFDELDEQLAELKRTRVEAVQNLNKSGHEAERQTFQEESTILEEQVRQIEDQKKNLKQHLQDLDAELAKASARLESLRSQRDSLNARYQLAQARLQMAGVPQDVEQWWQRALGFLPKLWMKIAAATAMSLLLIGLGYFSWTALKHNRSDHSASAASDVGPAGVPSEAGKLESLLASYNKAIPQNLIALLDDTGPNKNRAWYLKGGQLHSDSGAGGDFYFPYTLPRNYILEASVARVSGRGFLEFGLRVGNRHTGLVLDRALRYSGLTFVDGHNVTNPKNETQTQGNRISNEKTAYLKIVVAGDNVLAWLDGKPLVKWAGYEDRLTSEHNTDSYRDQQVALHYEGSQWKVSEFVVTPLIDTSKFMQAETDDVTRDPIRHLSSSSASVESLITSADGETYVTGGDDGLSRTWNSKTGTMISEFKHPLSNSTPIKITALALTSDMRRLVMGSGRSYSSSEALVVWDLDNERFLHALPPPANKEFRNLYLRQLAIHRDSGRLLYLDQSGVLYEWDVESGEYLEQKAIWGDLQGETYAMSSDGTSFVSIDDQGYVHRCSYDGESAPTKSDVVAQVPGWNSRLMKIRNSVISPGGRYIAVDARYSSQVQSPDSELHRLTVFDCQSKNTIIEQDYPNPQTIRGLETSSDGSRLAVSLSRRSEDSGKFHYWVQLWNLNSSSFIATLKSPFKVDNVKFSPDGKRVFVSGDSSLILEWDASQAAAIVNDAQRTIESVDIYAEGRTNGRLYLMDQSRLGYVDLKSDDPFVEVAQIKSNVVVDLEFTADNKKILIATIRGLLEWDVASGAEIRRFPEMTRELLYASLSPDNRYLATGSTVSQSKTMTHRLWDFASGKPLSRLETEYSFASPGTTRFSPNGETYAVGQVGKIVLKILETNEPVRELFIPYSPDAVSVTSSEKMSRLAPKDVRFSPDGSYLVAALSRRIHVWNLDTGNEVMRIRGVESPTSLGFTTDGQKLFCKDRNGVLRVWDFNFALSNEV